MHKATVEADECDRLPITPARRRRAIVRSIIELSSPSPCLRLLHPGARFGRRARRGSAHAPVLEPCALRSALPHSVAAHCCPLPTSARRSSAPTCSLREAHNPRRRPHSAPPPAPCSTAAFALLDNSFFFCAHANGTSQLPTLSPGPGSARRRASTSSWALGSGGERRECLFRGRLLRLHVKRGSTRLDTARAPRSVRPHGPSDERADRRYIGYIGPRPIADEVRFSEAPGDCLSRQEVACAPFARVRKSCLSRRGLQNRMICYTLYVLHADRDGLRNSVRQL